MDGAKLALAAYTGLQKDGLTEGSFGLSGHIRRAAPFRKRYRRTGVTSTAKNFIQGI